MDKCLAYFDVQICMRNLILHAIKEKKRLESVFMRIENEEEEKINCSRH